MRAYGLGGALLSRLRLRACVAALRLLPGASQAGVKREEEEGAASAQPGDAKASEAAAEAPAWCLELEAATDARSLCAALLRCEAHVAPLFDGLPPGEPLIHTPWLLGGTGLRFAHDASVSVRCC